ncbi:hypothetical protein DLAC_01650 [Tieghemostelium lacteum]|uniref:Uncharacterized protein n=1 Tax=Tieghemostelium lacteum TaxID=361077 RepID=A0A152A6F8_TIELA|nr:hypothetical protein DLAC_01650 [Tieghemostelium lacteum]|eukprot:KYR01647.1 hypothetical protein DLAC_01650 [Tieghemostelium lacteum]
MNHLSKSLLRRTILSKQSIFTRAHRDPIYFKDGKYDGKFKTEIIESEPDMMAPDADEQLERDIPKYSTYFLKFFGTLFLFGFTVYIFSNPNNKQVVERDLPFNNLYLEYGGDPNKQPPPEQEWRVKHGDRIAIYNNSRK